MTLLILSCSKEPEIEAIASEEPKQIEVKVQVVNNKLKFDNKESLAQFMEQNDQSEIKKKVNKFTEQGFKTLRPLFEDNEEDAMSAFLIQKQAKIAKKGYLYSSKNDDDDEIDLDDELISDANFAAILNEDREIYVGDSLYIYTTLGIYASKIGDEEYLRNYLSNESSKISSKEKLLAARGACNHYKSSISNNMLEPMKLQRVSIDSKINSYKNCGGSGGGSSGGSGSSSGSGSGGSSSTSLQASMPIIKPMSFGTCQYSEDSVWQSIFGNRVKCNDYHDSTHRVQTQFYNENYLLFNKIGMKVKYQKKRLVGWSQSSTADYVEMGINSLMFNYKNPYTIYNPFSSHHIKYKYKGVTYDMQGRVIQDRIIEPAWPISNESQILIPLVIEINDIIFPKWDIHFEGVTAGNVNDGIKELLKGAKSALSSEFRKNLKDNKVKVRIVRYAPKDTQVIVANRVTRGKSYTDYKFPPSFLLSYNSKNGSNAWKHFADQMNAKKHDKVTIDMYGAALRNGKIKGKRVIGKGD
ncbi:hypothetical protein [Flagellimonas onchidii]|uniref:hypothetical protein n=1 Tax=Flagellimonas onchidii TaxID=2562684 RepID=UPI0010A5F115|nr:hypothetical protein [Allomuricauda onchidii]